MTEPSRPRRSVLLARETWARRIARARATRQRHYRDRGLGWRLVAPAVFLSAGALFVTSAVSSDGTELRPGRFGDLSSVVAQAADEAEELQLERNDLAREVEELTKELEDASATRVQEQVRGLEMPAGFAAVSGPGLTVELDDAPPEEFDKGEVAADELIVHQQDIQAVVNALWAGGAEAMTIQGQRVISTTGIKCVGNTVVLHGIPYSPPYVITAVGDPAGMLTGLDESSYVDVYLDYVAAYGLGWDILPHSNVELPPYVGPVDLQYARPAGDGEPRTDSDL